MLRTCVGVGFIPKEHALMKNHLTILVSISLFAVGCADVSVESAASADEVRIRSVGDVYTLTNDATANSVVVYRRSADGTLTASSTVLTGGRGTSAGLGSQGALVLSENRRWLFAVNAGSNEVSSFRVSGDSLTLVSIVPSGGLRPVGLSVHDDLVYVVNADGGGNVSGFTVDDGELIPLAGSTRVLSGAATTAPAQVEFNPEGNVLVVTEKATNLIDTFRVRRDGTLSTATVTRSAGITPFGFAFNDRGVMVVSEAAGGAAGMGTASSYRLSSTGVPVVVSGAVREGQSAPCWVAIPRSGTIAYVTNTASGNISAYSIDRRGALALLNDGVTVSTGMGSGPLDMAISPDDRYAYVLTGGNGGVSEFRIGARGELTPIGTVSGLPARPAGLAVR
jgi:6-phosphogluconolactonase